MFNEKSGVSRRTFLTTSTSASAAVASGSLATNADLEQISGNVNTRSGPSALRITDMRIAHSDRSMLMRLDTNSIPIKAFPDMARSGTIAAKRTA
ncbi:MAG: twin-arginine translocation signal domain-containing protein [Bryobacteraceae bacterium]